MELRGWLFDLYPLDSSMILWIKEEAGCIRRFEEPFRPRFYAQGKRGDLFAFLHSFQKARRMTGWQWTRRREFWSGNEIEVMEIELGDASVYLQLPRILSPWEERVTFYNCDIPPSRSSAVERIIASGRTPVRLLEQGASSATFGATRLLPEFGLASDRLALLREFGTLLQAGLSVKRALTALQGLTARDRGKKAVQGLLDGILRVTGPTPVDDDLVTMLWEANLPHLQIAAVPLEGDVDEGGEGEDSEDGPRLPWPGDVRVAAAPARQGSQVIEMATRSDDFDSVDGGADPGTVFEELEAGAAEHDSPPEADQNLASSIQHPEYTSISLKPEIFHQLRKWFY